MSPAMMVLAILLIFIGLFILFRKRESQDRYPGKLKKSLIILDNLYKDVNGMEISLAERERLKTDNPSFTYGEVTFASIATSLAIAEPKKGEVFYDLGAGAGKGVFSAALLNDWKKCCGVEVLPALHECTQHLLKKLRNMPEAQQYFPSNLKNIHFIKSDMLNVDFSDADIVLTNATAFTPDLWESLTPKFEALKSGARLIVLTKRLNQNTFELIHETFLPMSWGMNSVMVYRRV